MHTDEICTFLEEIADHPCFNPDVLRLHLKSSKVMEVRVLQVCESGIRGTIEEFAVPKPVLVFTPLEAIEFVSAIYGNPNCS